MWYIWKARNDMRFNHKKWTVWPVYNSVAAEISLSKSPLHDQEDQIQAGFISNRPCYYSHRQGTDALVGNSFLIAGPLHEVDDQNSGDQDPALTTPRPPYYKILFPALLQGYRATDVTPMHLCTGFYFAGPKEGRNWCVHHRHPTPDGYYDLHQGDYE